ncbi:hypothetical protein Taro_012746 [Colocasia esculenta]|uniref:Uncharacterized protein n=1 Tax=Colocasia esculenta TaxID=4460 RepID=A0A843UDN0_COLES|nr:hypothetical protein [Colocasia esculenta]
MAGKGKAVTVAGASGVTIATSSGPRYCHYSGLRERFRIGDEYEIVDAKEGESYLVNKPSCLPLSVDHMEAGLRLPLPEVAKALLNPHFKLSASRSSGTDVYYAKHRADRMHIQLSSKYSNNKGWMDRLFFVQRRDGTEGGFPTVIRSAQKDSFPKLIQDEARASDSLLRADVRNGEGYLTEFSLFRHAVAELEAGRDQEANEDFAEQIPVMAHMVYEDDDRAAVVRVPSAVRVGTTVTTALVAPSPAKGCPEGTRVLEKGPEKIRLKKKATIKVVSAEAWPSFEEGEGATRPSAAMKKRPTLLDEGAEDADQLRARKKKRLVCAAPQHSEEGTEEEVDEAQLLLRKKRKAARSAEQKAPRMPPVVRPEVAQRMTTELGLIVESNGSESSAEEHREVSAPLGPSEGREEEVARTAASSTRSAGDDAAETFARRGEGNEETSTSREGISPRREVPERDVPEEAAASAAGATPTGVATTPQKEVVVVAAAPLPSTKMVAVEEVPSAVLVSTEVGEAAQGVEEVALVTEGRKEIADAAAETARRAEISVEQPVAAEEAISSGENRRPLSAVLKGKSSELPLQAMLEATLGRLGAMPRGPEKTPEHSSAAYRLGHLSEHDEDENVDVGALVDSIASSMGLLKKLAFRAQSQKQMWEAETAFCDDLVTKHQAREAELLKEVKSLQDALQTSELNLTVARAEKEAIAKVLAEARAQAVAEYKEGPDFKKDLEHFGDRCYKVGLEAGKEFGEKLAWTERAREAFEAAVKSRVGPEMKQDLLLFSWSWRPGVAVDWLASRLVDVDCLNLAAVDVDAKGFEEWLDDRRTRGVAELREETSRRGAIPVGARGGLGVNREINGWKARRAGLGFLQGLRPENLASTSFVAKLLSQDVNGQIPCR